MKITTLHTYDTIYSADSIEWCPLSAFRAYFVCGTYQLEENNQQTDESCKRKGCIYLFKLEKTTENLDQLHKLDTAAILDIKWLPIQSGQPILAAATALGEIIIVEMQQEKLNLVYTETLEAEQPCLALSLDVAKGETGNDCKILVSDSKGSIRVYQFNNTEDKPSVIKEQTWTSHNFEAWICAFDKWQKERIYSGGDDCLLNAYDLRNKQCILSNKSHEAGVTCILSHPVNPYQLLTGSYDEKLRSFDTRNMKQPLQSLNLHGGIWRLKIHPVASELLLVACMYENFSIVNVTKDSSNLQLNAVFTDHTSICYGADWCQEAVENDDIFYMATCSFYDHKMCVARVEKE